MGVSFVVDQTKKEWVSVLLFADQTRKEWVSVLLFRWLFCCQVRCRNLDQEWSLWHFAKNWCRMGTASKSSVFPLAGHYLFAPAQMPCGMGTATKYSPESCLAFGGASSQRIWCGMGNSAGNLLRNRVLSLTRQTYVEFGVEWEPRQSSPEQCLVPWRGTTSSLQRSHSDPCVCWCPWREGLHPRTLTAKGLGQSSVEGDAGFTGAMI